MCLHFLPDDLSTAVYRKDHIHIQAQFNDKTAILTVRFPEALRERMLRKLMFHVVITCENVLVK